MDNRTLREIELWSGLAAGVLGILLPAYGVLFASPPHAELGSIILVIVGLATAVAVGAMFDSLSSSTQALSSGLALLWAAAFPLLAMTLLPFGNIGLYVLPAAILAVVSALAGSYADLFTRRSTS